MLKYLIIALILVVSGCSSKSDAQSSSTEGAEKLAAELSAAEAVTFHFVSRTGDYDFDEDEMRRAATLTINRKCGGNCTNFMDDVVEHLRASQPVDCKTGQQNILVDLDGKQALTFSFSGRMVLFHDKCFFNQKSVSKLIEKGEFVFQ